MSTAREMMHQGAECVRPDDTLTAAAAMMRDLHVGALPIADSEDRLQGIITDRDIVVRGLADGLDPGSTPARQLVTAATISVGADSDVGEVLHAMEEHKIRRLPVVDNQRVVGMISEADVVTHLTQGQIADFASAVYSAPPNN